MSDRLVLVTGATGFIGRVVVRRLLQADHRVRAGSRRAPGDGVFPPHDGLEIVRVDLRDQDSLVVATRGVDAVVHLAAATADERDSEDVNVGGARRLVAACEAAGCRRVVNVSTQSAKIARKGVYARTKHEAERVFHASSLAVTTLRPSIVYGQPLAGVFGTVARFLQVLPVVPVLGDGRWVSAPIHVDDVATAILACLARDRVAGAIYDLGGPDRVSFDELLSRIASAVGRRRPVVHVPYPVALWVARAAEALLPRPPITVSNVLGSNQDTSLDPGPAMRDLDLRPRSLDIGLREIFPSPTRFDAPAPRSGS